MDANSYMLSLRGTGRSLQHGVREAEWIGKGQAGVGRREAGASSTEAAKEESVSESQVSGLKPDASSKASSLAASIPGVSVAKEAAAEPPQASPVPRLNLENRTLDAEITESGIVMNIGNRVYRIRGLEKNAGLDSMKLNVMVRRNDGVEKFFVDTLDLYAARVRSAFTKEAAMELGFDVEVIKRDLGRVLMTLETIQEHKLAQTEPKDKPIEIDEADKAAALELLQSPDLVQRILTDFETCGVVGEKTNKLVGYLSATSRKLGKPLAVVIQSSSAAGKSSLMDAVLSFIPPEEQVGYRKYNTDGRLVQHAEPSAVLGYDETQADLAVSLRTSDGLIHVTDYYTTTGSGAAAGYVQFEKIKRGSTSTEIKLRG